MFYITGDIHGNIDRIVQFIQNKHLTSDDAIIILGDVCLNFYMNEIEKEKKRILNSFGVKILCIQGNHERRPEGIGSYHTINYLGAKAMIEDDFPNLIFLLDGEVYSINGNKTLVLGGAYSVDKWYRMARALTYMPLDIDETKLNRAIAFVNGDIQDTNNSLKAFLTEAYCKCPEYYKTWFSDEQMTDEAKKKVEQLIMKNNKFDIILSHTCPNKFEPTEMYLSGLDQSSVDKSMEKWLDKIESKIEYGHWYCGHWHTDKELIGKNFTFLFNKTEPLC